MSALRLLAARFAKGVVTLSVLVGALAFAGSADAAGGSFGGGRSGGFGGAGFMGSGSIGHSAIGHGAIGHGYGNRRYSYNGQQSTSRAPFFASRQPNQQHGAMFGEASRQSRPNLNSRAHVGSGEYSYHPQTQYLRPVTGKFRRDQFDSRFRNRFDGYGVGGFEGYGGYSAGSAPLGAAGYGNSASYAAEIEQAYAPPFTTRIIRGSRGRGAVAVTTQEPGFQSQASYNSSGGYAGPRTIRVSR